MSHHGFLGGDVTVWRKPVLWDDPYELVDEEPLDLPPGPILYARHVDHSPSWHGDPPEERLERVLMRDSTLKLIYRRMDLDDKNARRTIQKQNRTVRNQKVYQALEPKRGRNPDEQGKTLECLDEAVMRCRIFTARMQYGALFGLPDHHWLTDAAKIVDHVKEAQAHAICWQAVRNVRRDLGG
jgi:hypothetical protein